MSKRITEPEVEKLYIEFNTPEHVIRHCRAVTGVALKLSEELNKHGYSLDLALIRGAGLAHDVARTGDEHWNVGADALENLGYFDEAKIIRVHMFYSPFNSVDRLNETDMVCLGDRLVKEDKYVGLDKRIEYIINKAPKSEEILHSILERKEETQKLLLQIEDIIGTSIDKLFQEKKTNEK